MGKYEKYIISEPLPNSHEFNAEGKTTRQNIICMNESVAPFIKQYFMISWHQNPVPNEKIPSSHVHDTDEFIGFIGTNPDDPADLGAAVRFLVGDEWLTLDKSGIIYIPAGVPHCPYAIENLQRPIIIFSGCPDGHYEMK